MKVKHILNLFQQCIKLAQFILISYAISAAVCVVLVVWQLSNEMNAATDEAQLTITTS